MPVPLHGREDPTIFGDPSGPTRIASGNRFFRPGLLACVSAVFLAAWAGWDGYASPFIEWQLLAYPLALILGWCGEGWLRGEALRGRVVKLGRGIWAHRIEIGLLALITLVDLALHFWLAAQAAFLHGSVHDEGFVGLNAWRLIHQSGPWPLYSTMGGAVAMYQPLGWLFLHFPPSMLLLRLFAIPMAIAVAPAFYLLARQLVGIPAALGATTLLAVAYWPTMMGSLAFGWMNGSVFQCLGLALLLHGLRRWSLTACAASGMVLALCLYSYSTHRLMPIPAAIVLALFLVRGGETWRRRWLLSGTCGFAFLVTAAPWIRLVTTVDVLLKGDATYMTHYFTDAWRQNPLTALGEALSNAASLNLALIARPLGGYPYMVLPSGGLIDPLTTGLILLGVLGAVLTWRRVESVMLLTAIVLPIPPAAMAIGGLSEVYRLNGMVPALFLAAALSLDRMVGLTRAHARAGMVILLLICLLGSAVNIQRVVSFVRDAGTICRETDVYATFPAAYIALADQVNGLGPDRAVYLVTDSADPSVSYGPAWTWLFHRAFPVQALAIQGQDPARWILQANPERPRAPDDGARFWPPRLGPGERGITYFLLNDASSIFMPFLRHAFRQGRTQILRPPQCAATGYRLTSYSLTARQIQGPGR